jgi:hypothetical protein
MRSIAPALGCVWTARLVCDRPCPAAAAHGDVGEVEVVTASRCRRRRSVDLLGERRRLHLHAFRLTLASNHVGAAGGGDFVADVRASALSRVVGVATEMLLTKAQQVSDDVGACAAGYTFSGSLGLVAAKRSSRSPPRCRERACPDGRWVATPAATAC